MFLRARVRINHNVRLASSDVMSEAFSKRSVNTRVVDGSFDNLFRSDAMCTAIFVTGVCDQNVIIS